MQVVELSPTLLCRQMVARNNKNYLRFERDNATYIQKVVLFKEEYDNFILHADDLQDHYRQGEIYSCIIGENELSTKEAVVSVFKGNPYIGIQLFREGSRLPGGFNFKGDEWNKFVAARDDIASLINAAAPTSTAPSSLSIAYPFYYQPLETQARDQVPAMNLKNRRARKKTQPSRRYKSQI